MPAIVSILVFVAEHFGVPALEHFLVAKFPEFGKEVEESLPGLVKLIIDIVEHRQTSGPSAPLPESIQTQMTNFSPAAIRMPDLVR